MSKQNIKTLILAAHQSELKPFVDLGRKYLHIDEKKETAYLAAGIGPVAASFGLTHFLEDYKPERIIAIGTAGIINDEEFTIGDIIVAKSVATATGFDERYTPKLQKSRIDLNVGAQFIAPTINGRNKLRPYDHIKPAKIYCPQEITRDETCQKLLKKKYDVEHLEAFAFAYVAKKFRIPIEIYLGLTNFVKKNAHKEWAQNNEKMVQLLFKQIRYLVYPKP